MKEEIKTLVFGASLKEVRYSNMAVRKLRKYGHPVVAIGGREGQVVDVDILRGHPELEDIHTITMYMRAARQEAHYEYLLGLKPKRIIFNPGAENEELTKLANEQGIETLNACTLVLLSTNQYGLALKDLSILH